MRCLHVDEHSIFMAYRVCALCAYPSTPRPQATYTGCPTYSGSTDAASAPSAPRPAAPGPGCAPAAASAPAAAAGRWGAGRPRRATGRAIDVAMATPTPLAATISPAANTPASAGALQPAGACPGYAAADFGAGHWGWRGGHGRLAALYDFI